GSGYAPVGAVPGPRSLTRTAKPAPLVNVAGGLHAVPTSPHARTPRSAIRFTTGSDPGYARITRRRVHSRAAEARRNARSAPSAAFRGLTPCDGTHTNA